MKAQRTPIRVSLPAGESLRDPTARIEKVSIGDGSFLPPNQAFAERNISPRHGNTLILSALGFTATSIATMYDLQPSVVSTHHYRLREKIELPSITASSRAIFALGATVLEYGRPIVASTDQLDTLEQISYGINYDKAAHRPSPDRPQPFSETAIRKCLLAVRRNNNDERTNLIITRAMLSGQLGVDGAKLPNRPPEQLLALIGQPLVTDEAPNVGTLDSHNTGTHSGEYQLRVWVPNNDTTPDGRTIIGGYTQTVPIH